MDPAAELAVPPSPTSAAIKAEEEDDVGPLLEAPAPLKAGDRAISGRAAWRPRTSSVDYRAFLPERFEVDVAQRYDLDKLTLGEGGYGKVFVAKDKQFSNREVVVKKVTKTSHKATESFKREIEIMKELDHPNICKLLETFEHGRHMFFVMEFCEGGEVFERIFEKGQISEGVTSEIISQVASALRYAHSRGIAHRDIKPENICFATKEEGDSLVKVIDWGLGILFDEKEMKSAVGSMTYAAPEVVQAKNDGSYSNLCDLWSLGVLTYVMLCGRPPFWGSQSQMVASMKACRYPLSGAQWDSISDTAKDFIRVLLMPVPEDRLAIDRVTEHAWLMESRGGLAATHTDSSTEVLKNLRNFSNSSLFQTMCVASVARQLDHRHLRDIHAVFRAIDTNGDGVLSLQEVADGFKSIFGEGSAECSHIEEMFERLDLDGSGSIDYTEFCAAGIGARIGEQEDVLWAAFKSWDKTGDHVLTLADVQQALQHADTQHTWSKEVCDAVGRQIMSRYDTDGSGSIDFDEWRNIMRETAERLTPESVPAAGAGEAQAPSELEREMVLIRAISTEQKPNNAYALLREVSRLGDEVKEVPEGVEG